MEQKNDSQDIALENNEQAEVNTEENQGENTEENSEDATEARLQALEEKNRVLEGEVGKYKRLLDKKERKIPTKKTSKTSQTTDDEIDFGHLAFYNGKSDSIRIESQEDIDFLRETMQETGKSQEALLGSKWFLSELRDREQANRSANAIPKSNNRSGQANITEIDVAVAKYRETGELPSDFATRNKVIDIITDKENKNMFDGPGFVGNAIPR